MTLRISFRAGGALTRGRGVGYNHEVNGMTRVPRAMMWGGAVAVWLWVAGFIPRAGAEVILQYFNTSWRELAVKMPELAEVGYKSLWLPPPTKASGGLSVGYDLWDPFDLGGKDQRNTVRTRYGTEADLHHLIAVAHRFGIRVYFDNIMNHRAFDVPGFNEFTPIGIYPGMVPEDFHLRTTADGFYRKWDNVANWGDAWQVQNRNFSDLIDIAQEMPDNANFGPTEGSTIPKIRLVRHPQNPEYYCFAPGPGGAVYVGFGSTNITPAMLTNPANAWLYEEDVNAYLMRAVRWLVDRTKTDGLRLDAVKHVPDYFFGAQGAGRDASGAGYTGQAQEQFNLTRGFSDWDNHRDSVFNTEQARDDLMMFGEHLGEPPGFAGYIAAGMRLVDSPLHGFLNGNLGQPWGTLDGLQYPGGRGFAAPDSVPYVKSHDDDYATRPELQFALNLTRAGLPTVYTDGNYQAETLGESGGAFPRHANIAFLGQFGDNRIPNLVYIHNHFARGDQYPRWGDGDVVAYERVDKRERPAMSDADGAVLFFVMNDDYSAGAYREINTSFPVGAHLWQYSSAGAGFYYVVPPDQKIKVITPPGGYFAFSWRSPEESDLWRGAGGRPLTILQDERETGWVSYKRKDGSDGDPGFNPYGVADTNASDFTYTYFVPRVTAGTNLTFRAHVDGSAAHVKIKLDGGMDLNGVAHHLGDLRDHPPGINPNGVDNAESVDMFLGYENAAFVHRQWREKFAARNTLNHNVIGSDGAETYQATIGQSNFVINTGLEGRNAFDQTAAWVFHDPAQVNEYGDTHFWPPPQDAADAPVYLWVKVGYTNAINRVFVYYTVDGVTYPEGAGGMGIGQTRTAELFYATNGVPDGGGVPDWWTGVLPPLPAGTVLRYKVGAYKQQGYAGAPWSIAFPNDAYSIANKRSMLGVWRIADFDATAAVYHPHNDYGPTKTGLEEGFHIVRARAFLERPTRASIYNTFAQTFYYDVQRPTGAVVFPAENDLLGQNEYGAVVRTDATVTEVWYHIADADPSNDDGATGQPNGNGLTTNTLGGTVTAWQRASPVTPSLSINSPYPHEWRFSYRNIPSGGSNATIHVRLMELSSATNMTLSDVEGHFTTLLRGVRTGAPDQRLFFEWPQADGEVVEAGWLVRVRFSKSLGDGIDDATLRDRFLVRINGGAVGKDLYTIVRDVDGTNGELSFLFPTVFNGDPDFEHHIMVTHQTGGGVMLEANRFVRTRPANTGPHIDIVQPPEFDSDGKAVEIVLPDVASPTPEDRQFLIRVETGLDAQHVWLAFTNSVGQTTMLPQTFSRVPGRVDLVNGSAAVVGREAALSGTVTVEAGEHEALGSGTAFLAELDGGEFLRLATNFAVVTQVQSDTALTLGAPFPAPGVSNATAWVQPMFGTAPFAGERLLLGGLTGQVLQVHSPSNLTLTAAYAGPTTNGLQALRIGGNPTVSNGRMYWHFLWTDMTPGRFTFYAFVNTNSANTSIVSGHALRNTTVLLRQMVTNNPVDLDDDDDGLYDTFENTTVNLPPTNPETWLNGDVHAWRIFGRTNPLLPDTDGDGLPDGLELGWRKPIDTAHTDPTTDTNGDGFPNFRPDLDPPFFNTVPDNSGLPGFVFNASRTLMIHGSMTDPNRRDTDGDGIPDALEDRNRNGWVDGDGKPLMPDTVNPLVDRPNPGDWPDGVRQAWENWLETDPNNPDTDGDGLSDGYGEDVNFNGRVDMALWFENGSQTVFNVQSEENGKYVYGSVFSRAIDRAALAADFRAEGDGHRQTNGWPRLVWLETDPLNADTDGDGLPDGWEVRYGFDPLNPGIVGWTNLRTGLLVMDLDDQFHGPDGNPDGDVVVLNGVTNEYTNIMEFQNGTHPRQFNALDPPPEGDLQIGSGPVIGTLGNLVVSQEFLDWTWADCLALDPYEGDGPNNQQGDVFMAYDGWDSSRDLVAFYARDGGDPGSGGDGRFYFRVDMHDLRANAEDGNLNIYVVIDTGNPASGEMNLPDEVDAMTLMRWEAVVAVYGYNRGRVYVDLNRNLNTTAIGQDLGAHGVVARDENAADGFEGAHFNAELDAVEFAISRQALLDAGWSGFGATNFNYQVFTTKDGTGNSPQGPGDIGGRNDIRDAIYNDYIAEDYWQAQQGIDNTLRFWIPGNSQARRAKVAVIIHGNHAVEPGSVVQQRINNGAGAGFYRPLDAHALFAKPVGLHVTPTLAMAIEWAAVDPAVNRPWRDGPAFNRRVAALIQTNVVELLGSTFSDHMLPYFSKAFNRDNEALARRVLGEIYGVTLNPAQTVFWTPERLLDRDGFEKILDMGYPATILDQDTHLQNWFGRTESLIDNAYRVNRIDGVQTFAIHNIPTASLFVNHDGGVDLALRALFSRKARRGVTDQVITLFADWSAFGDAARANAYDRNIRWIANRPWVELVTHGQILRGEVDLNGDGSGEYWGQVDRGSVAGQAKQAHNWLNHATQEDYDTWYLGSPIEEGLFHRQFEIRPGVSVGTRYGMEAIGDGLVAQSWNAVQGIGNSNLAVLARATLHASVFQTAFHNEGEHDLRRYSTGTYIAPATGSNTLAGFAVQAQAQTRKAAVYARVAAWAAGAGGMAQTETSAEDVDLDSEDEYLLFNDRLFVVFERVGGRAVGVWARDRLDGEVFQAAGNMISAAGTETEWEGASNVGGSSNVVAYRTSVLKDWWVTTGPDSGTAQYVNDLFNVAAVSNGWRFTSADGRVRKTVTLAPKAGEMEVEYLLSGDLAGQTLYVRHGLTPNLYDLMVRGQRSLESGPYAAGVYQVASTNFGKTVVARIGYADGAHNAGLTPNAVDDNPGQGVNFDTVRLRNQAQTEQVELYGTGLFRFSLGFRVLASDWDSDGIPNLIEDQYPFLDPYNPLDAEDDWDGDGVSNLDEFIAGTAPDDADDFFQIKSPAAVPEGFQVRFPAHPGREYAVWYEHQSLVTPAWSNATPQPISVQTPEEYLWTDTGATTGGHPAISTQRYYRVDVRLLPE